MTAPNPTSLKKQFSDITLAEAERAIYIDFEGFENKSPHLIGVLIDDTYQSIVLDPELTLAAEQRQLHVMQTGVPLSSGESSYEVLRYEQGVKAS